MMTILLLLALWTADAHRAPCPPPVGAVSEAVCKCGYPSVEGAFDESRAVFSGVVLEVQDIPTVARTDSAGRIVVAKDGPWDHVVTLRVTRGWKGTQPGDTVTVRDVFVCGVGFRRGEEYLVYTYVTEDGVLFSTPCQRTRAITLLDGTHDFRLPPAGEDIRVLDGLVRGRRP